MVGDYFIEQEDFSRQYMEAKVLGLREFWHNGRKYGMYQAEIFVEHFEKHKNQSNNEKNTHSRPHVGNDISNNRPKSTVAVENGNPGRSHAKAVSPKDEKDQQSIKENLQRSLPNLT